jgi:uncharacterized membrane protein YfcA
MREGRESAYLDKKELKKAMIIAIGGVIAGFCNGLLGAGGGIVIVLAFSAVFPSYEESKRSLYANALCVMLPLSLLTLASYALRGDIPQGFLGDDYASILVGGAVGGLLGAIILGRLGSGSLRKIFAILTVISGVLMII